MLVRRAGKIFICVAAVIAQCSLLQANRIMSEPQDCQSSDAKTLCCGFTGCDFTVQPRHAGVMLSLS
jgi:hypothetical protein